MCVYKRGNVWWYRFTWKGEAIRESTAQSNKRIAELAESNHKAMLARRALGIKQCEPAPTLNNFVAQDFLPFIETTKAPKPNTVRFYRNSAAVLTGYSRLGKLPLDEITTEHIAGFVAHRQKADIEVSTINADLATLRRILQLAHEWGRTFTPPPRIRMLAGANRRERILAGDEERKYLDAATALGFRLSQGYKDALRGIRAVVRGEQPQKPDAFLVRDTVTILIDCGLRPEECFRLKWTENIGDGVIEIHHGKGRGSRRKVPCTARVIAILAMRRSESTSEWVFPARTRSGHIEGSTLKKQHAAVLKACGVAPFVFYTLRHTCITRWAKYVHPSILHKIAGHTDMNMTMRYVHISDADVLEAMSRAHAAAAEKSASSAASLQ